MTKSPGGPLGAINPDRAIPHTLPPTTPFDPPSRLPRPYLICDPPHQLQLAHHVLVPDEVPAAVARKPALWTDTQPVERLLSPAHDLRRLVHAPLHRLELLHLRELARHEPEHDALVGRQVRERSEPACPRRVVLKVVRVDAEPVEEFDGDCVVAAL